MVDLMSLTNTVFEMEIEGTTSMTAFTAVEAKTLLKYSNSCFTSPSHRVLQNKDFEVVTIKKLSNHGH